MASVSEILARLNLSRRDLSNVSLSQLRTIFQDLTVKEISKLCAVNRRFNTVCEDESFWRNKVLNDYGIEKKYGNTWRQTARNMDKFNMINMNDVWFDGRTYRKILNDTLQNGVEVILDLQEKYLLPYADHFHRDALILLFEHKNDDVELQNFANQVLDRNYREDELNDIYYIKSREINVIYATVLTYKGENGIYLPGHTLTNVIDYTILPLYELIRNMIDPIFYMMQFSSFSVDRLNSIVNYYGSGVQ
uniref:F-box-like protein n=1 Tax=Pithovirus LCPAC401 TaxID=2506595 RepID=A0A481ZAV6_9VIRU|nr:MAG: F-box-like protein [Pithovirus LCPAC401]